MGELHSASTLHYGVTLSLADVVLAAQIFRPFIANSSVLDLLIARKDSGVPIKAGPIRHLPVELLLEIKRHLRAEYLSKETPYLTTMHKAMITMMEEGYWQTGELRDSECECGDPRCHNALNDAERRKEKQAILDRIRDPSRWTTDDWDLHGYLECEACLEMRHDGVFWSEKDFPNMTEDIRALVGSYGLALPSLSPMRRDEDDFDHSKAAWLVALPSYISDSASSRTAGEPSTDMTTSQAVHYARDFGTFRTATTFSPSFFHTTRYDDIKFRKLVDDYQIRVVELDKPRHATRRTRLELLDEEKRLRREEEDARVEKAKQDEKAKAEKLKTKKKAKGNLKRVKAVDRAAATTQAKPVVEKKVALRPQWLLVHESLDIQY